MEDMIWNVQRSANDMLDKMVEGIRKLVKKNPLSQEILDLRVKNLSGKDKAKVNKECYKKNAKN